MQITFSIDDAVSSSFNSGFCYVTNGPTDPAQQQAWVAAQVVAYYKATVKRGLGLQAIAAIAAQVGAATISDAGAKVDPVSG